MKKTNIALIALATTVLAACSASSSGSNVDQLTAEVPFYAVRHCVKPGVTGWAQVRYQYGASVDDAVQKLQYDLYYVKNHTLLLDIVVLAETIRVVLTGEGAQ